MLGITGLVSPRVHTYAMRFVLLISLDIAAHFVPQTVQLWAPLDFGAAIAYGQTWWIWKSERRVALTEGKI